MRLWVAILALLLALPAASAPRESKRTVTANGRYRFQLFEDAPGSCRVEVTSDSGPVWSLPTCVGETTDAFFLSADAQRFWVLKTLPNRAEHKDRHAGAGRQRRRVAPGWGQTVVAVLHDRTGRVLEERKLESFLTPEGYRKVRSLAKRFTWIEGVNGVPGKGPRFGAGGQVTFETVEGRTHELSLEPPVPTKPGRAKLESK